MVSWCNIICTVAEGAAVEAAEDVVAQVMLPHNFGDFAIAPAAEERLNYGRHVAAAMTNTLSVFSNEPHMTTRRSGS
jgi:hypothetical protein